MALVSFCCYEEGNNKPVKIITSLVKDILYTCTDRGARNSEILRLLVPDLSEEFNAIPNYFVYDVAIHLVEKSSGLQALIYQGRVLRQGRNLRWFFNFGRFSSHDVVEGDRIPKCSIGDISMILRKKNVCGCSCVDSSTRNLFKMPRRRKCCKCEEKWSCFNTFDIQISSRHHEDVLFLFVNNILLFS